MRPWPCRLPVALSAALLSTAATPSTAPPRWELEVVAPPSLQPVARRVEQAEAASLEAALARAGLDLPPQVRVVLVAEHESRARSTPLWVVGLAVPPRDIVIFPARIAAYPYDSIESVLRHEVAHLALEAAAGGQPLPRWFHEGVAISVDAGWRVVDQARLFFEVAREPAVAEVETLFAAGEQHRATRAYLLAAALMDDVRRRHGATLPGEIARSVAGGVAFERAFELRTGRTPEQAARIAWTAYWRWTVWVPLLTSGLTVWLLILAVAVAAFMVRRRRRARLRQKWEDEEAVSQPEEHSRIDAGVP